MQFLRKLPLKNHRHIHRLLTAAFSLKLVKVPPLGDSISSGVMVEVNAKVGDYFKKDDVLGIIETDKIQVSIFAPVTGMVKEIKAEEEEQVVIGQELFVIDTEGKASGAKVEENVKVEEKVEKEKVEKVVKEENQENLEKEEKIEKKEEPIQNKSQLDVFYPKEYKYTLPKSRIFQIMKAKGDSISQDDVVIILRSGDIFTDVKAPQGGSIKSLNYKKGDSVKFTDKLFSMADLKEKQIHQKKKALTYPEEENIEKQPNHEPLKFNREIHSKPFNQMRQTITKKLKEAQNEYVMLTTFQEIDMTEMVRMKKLYEKEFFQKHRVKLTFFPLFLKAVSSALLKYPTVNSRTPTHSPIYKQSIRTDFAQQDISFAVAIQNGILVPVVRNVESLTVPEIAKKVNELTEKAREHKIKLKEMQGGTFQMTNNGVFGTLFGTPIPSKPHTAALSLNAVKKRAVVLPNNKIVARSMMYTAMTYDHRILDGKDSGLFMMEVKRLIERPSRLILGL